MGYSADDIVLVLNRADSNIGISMDDVQRLLGKSPDVLVPSDRAVPRALTSGQTITEADPRSGAARAFAQLADFYLGSAASRVAVPDFAQSETGQPSRRRRALLRRGN
jgi:Flp pilus assembly CpaE family ATPase